MKILAQHQAGETAVRVLETLSDGSRRYYDGAVLYTAVAISIWQKLFRLRKSA